MRAPLSTFSFVETRMCLFPSAVQLCSVYLSNNYANEDSL